jgi:hypothetical protein
MRQAVAWVKGNPYPVHSVTPIGVQFPDFDELSVACGTNTECVVDIGDQSYSFFGKIVRMPQDIIMVAPCGQIPDILRDAIAKWEKAR